MPKRNLGRIPQAVQERRARAHRHEAIHVRGEPPQVRQTGQVKMASRPDDRQGQHKLQQRVVEGGLRRMHGIDDCGQRKPPHVPHRHQKQQDGESEFGPQPGLQHREPPNGFLLLRFPCVHHIGFRGHGRCGEPHIHGPLPNLLDKGFGV